LNTDRLDEWEITGRARTHVDQSWQPRFAAQPAAAAAFLAMRQAALRDGFDLLPCASWRPFESQLRIWNRKFAGDAVLYDMNGRPRERAALTPEELVAAILGWSGLPGASRRHWGSDIDVYDRAAMPPGYRLKLLPDEVAPGGVFAPLHAWLDVHLQSFGFFRPYCSYRGGMYPEPWHLSHAPSARRALAALDIDVLASVLRKADMQGRELVLAMLPELWAKHVLGTDPP
jgi:LAS superfamily LD-carboxypeptidase LdcB